jgi:hypothetical protein
MNSTLALLGTYEAVFNEETGELSIVKGRKVVAKTATQLKMRDSKGRLTEITQLRTAIRPHADFRTRAVASAGQ